MKATLIFLPVLAQVLLTLAMYVLLLQRKKAAIATGKVDFKKTATDNRAWPKDVLLVSNNIANQFEVPALFYILCLTFVALDAVSVWALGLAALFVLSRYVHTFVHVTTNYVPVRMKVFSVGIVALFAMTGLATYQVVMG
jgi:hypothetical protein